MKAPKIVQSYWSKAYQNTPNSGWAFRESHYMSWALSCLQLKQFYDEIELVTDSEGADLLINKLHLPYTSCLTILDKLKNENPAIWALGKIAAYEVQQEPFIHVDGDIYIWKPFPKRIEEAGIVAQNIEKNYSMGINLLDEMRDKNFTFPFHLSLVDMCESNMGITGGHDLNFFKDYCSMVHGFLEVNRDKLASLSGGVSSVNTIMEQYLMYEYAQRRGKKIECLIPSLPNTEMYKLTLFCLLPKEVSFIHNIGSNKRREIMSDRLARLLYCSYPRHYAHIINLLKQESI
jgi:hypothetical protein